MIEITPYGIGKKVGLRYIPDGEEKATGTFLIPRTLTLEDISENMVLSEDETSLREVTADDILGNLPTNSERIEASLFNTETDTGVILVNSFLELYNRISELETPGSTPISFEETKIWLENKL